MIKLITMVLLLMSTVTCTASTLLPTGVVEGGHDAYSQFLNNAQAGFMQIVTIPVPSEMRLDDYDYLWVNHDQPLTNNHDTFAVSGEADDARTQMGCFEAWSWNKGDTTDPNYGEAFCISDNDMLWLFDHGAYSLSYSGY